MMRAKFHVHTVQKHGDPVVQETLSMNAVSSKPYDANGNNEDNTFSKYTPSATCVMTITNPNLLGKISQGDKFYVDFTKADD